MHGILVTYYGPTKDSNIIINFTSNQFEDDYLFYTVPNEGWQSLVLKTITLLIDKGFTPIAVRETARPCFIITVQELKPLSKPVTQ